MNYLNQKAQSLLRFAEQSIVEALGDLDCRQGLLIEAESALRVLQNALVRAGDPRRSDLALLGVFDRALGEIDEDTPDVPWGSLEGALAGVRQARVLFQ
jgi:hypothetical protein